MNPIKLTDLHTCKLVEMCKYFFPEYKWIQTKPHQESIIQLCKNAEDRVEFHWFEFCMTRLINELAFRNISSDFLGDCEFEEFRMKCINEIFKDKSSNEIIHPIDYLYEQFKQLKIN